MNTQPAVTSCLISGKSVTYAFRLGCRCINCRVHRNAYFQKTKDRAMMRMKAYYEAHKEGIQKYKADYYAQNSEKIKEKVRQTWQKKPLESRLAFNLRKYGLTVAAYKTLLEDQDGKCAICMAHPKIRLAVDHDHRTEKVRGLLCSPCNTGLGMFKERLDLLQKARIYLRRTAV